MRSRRLALGSSGFSHIIIPLFVIVAVGLVGSYYLVATHAATPSPVANTIKSGYSGFCVDDQNDSSGTNAQVQAVSCDGTNAQTWYTGFGNGTIHHTKSNSSACIGPKGGTLSAGTGIVTVSCSAMGTGWNWSNGQIAEKSNQNLCISTPKGAKPVGSSQLVLAACNSGNMGVKWAFAKSDSGTGSGGGVSTSGSWPNTWVLANSSMNNIRKSDDAVAAAAFDTSGTYLSAALGANNPVPSGWKSVPTVNFKSYAAFSQAVSSGKMPSWTKAVLYDPEDWSQTPKNEQTNPTSYMEQFGQLGHKHGWIVVITPGTDLMNAVSHPGETDPQAYIKQDIAGAAAKDADISETQAQSDEFTPSSYAAYLSQAHAQAVAANPKIVFLGGLTADLSGKTASSSVMSMAAKAAKGDVSGFFFNVSGSSPDPSNAAGMLQSLGY